MIAYLFKNLSCVISKHTLPVCRSAPVPSSLSLRSLSNSAQTRPGISPTSLDVLLHKYNFPPDLASRVTSELTYLENPEKVDSMLDSMISFFKECGFLSLQLVKLAKHRPHILAASLKGIIPKIEILQDMGMSFDDITKIISINPKILDISLASNIIPSPSVLEDLLRSDSGGYIVITRPLTRSPWFQLSDSQKAGLPNVSSLKSCVIPEERKRIILRTQPTSLLTKSEIYRRCAEKQKEMELHATSDNFICAVSDMTLKHNECWELKLQDFRDLGFSNSDISTMFRTAPFVFLASIEKIKKVKELLLATGKYNMCSIVSYPLCFAASIEDRYIPRLKVLGILERRNLIDNWPTLSAVSMLSDDVFFKRFVSPYSNQVSDLCLLKICVRK